MLVFISGKFRQNLASLSRLFGKPDQAGEEIFQCLRCMGRSPVNENRRSVIRAYDEAGNAIQTHEQAGDFNES
jgi:hypothetical protein